MPQDHAVIPRPPLAARGFWGALGLDRWAVAWMALAVTLSLLPPLLSSCCAPAGKSGFGSVWFVNDFAQYESAMRQGAERPDWLVRDPFTAEPNSPVFMFPLYVGVGKLANGLGGPALVLERVTELVARILFLLALWRFARAFGTSLQAARAAFLVALLGSGIGPFAAAASAFLGLPIYGGNWSYELNTFGLLFAAPHVPLAMAATLELSRWLLPGHGVARWDPWVAALLGAALALLHPFHVPVLLLAIGVTSILRGTAGDGRFRSLRGALAATLGALPVLAPTVWTFSLDPFWSATYTWQNLLPSPVFHELFVDMGVPLVLALLSLWFLRERAAPVGLLVWLAIIFVAMYVPIPYQRRLSFGLHPLIAILAGNWVATLWPRASGLAGVAARVGTVILAGLGSLLLVAATLVSLVGGGPLPLYRSTPDLDAAAEWLNQRVAPGETILADWDTSNYLAARTPGNVMGGHPVATLRPTEKRLLLETFFAHGGNLAVARQLGAEWVVYGPGQVGQPRPGEAPMFASGLVAVYRSGQQP